MNEVIGRGGGSKDISTVRQITEIVVEENKYNMVSDWVFVFFLILMFNFTIFMLNFRLKTSSTI